MRRQTIWRITYRIFRPTIQTVGFLVAFSLLGIVLNSLSMIDRRTGRDNRKWKYSIDDLRKLANDKTEQDDVVDYGNYRVRARREKVDRFLSERDLLWQEIEKMRMRGELEQSEIESANQDPKMRLSKISKENNTLDRLNGPKNVWQQQLATEIHSLNGKNPGERRELVQQQSANKPIPATGKKPPESKMKKQTKVERREIENKDRVPNKVNKRRVVSTLTPNRHFARNASVEREVSRVKRRRWCSVHNTTTEVASLTGGNSDGEFDCILLRIKPPTTVCLYANDDDVHVSRHLREDGLWEPHEVRLFQNLLFQNPDLDVIDIGAHIGQYALLAASMGRRVVAIEPYPPSIRRLHKAIKIGRLESKVVLVTNPVSDERGEYIIDAPSDNQGGATLRFGSSIPCDDLAYDESPDCPANVSTTILMDDLLEVMTTDNFRFRRAVMKIDIEGHEHLAFGHADRLFDTVQIPYIFMEWIKLRAHYGAEVDDTKDKRRVQKLVDWLTDRGYVAYSLVLIQQLKPEFWYGWPDDIIWQHQNADPFF